MCIDSALEQERCINFYRNATARLASEFLSYLGSCNHWYAGTIAECMVSWLKSRIESLQEGDPVSWLMLKAITYSQLVCCRGLTYIVKTDQIEEWFRNVCDILLRARQLETIGIIVRLHRHVVIALLQGDQYLADIDARLGKCVHSARTCQAGIMETSDEFACLLPLSDVVFQCFPGVELRATDCRPDEVLGVGDDSEWGFREWFQHQEETFLYFVTNEGWKENM